MWYLISHLWMFLILALLFGFYIGWTTCKPRDPHR